MKLRCKPEQPDLEAQQRDDSVESEEEKRNVKDSGSGGERGDLRRNREDGEERETKAVSEGEHEDDGELEVKKLTEMSVEYEPLGVNRRRNRNVSAEILGGFESKECGPGTRYAIVTLDGTVLLVDHGTKDPMDSIMWNLQVDHQLMCLSKLDVTGI